MKSKKKLLLMGVGVMGALAMGVGATSTFAWYTATTTLNVQSSETNVPGLSVDKSAVSIDVNLTHILKVEVSSVAPVTGLAHYNASADDTTTHLSTAYIDAYNNYIPVNGNGGKVLYSKLRVSISIDTAEKGSAGHTTYGWDNATFASATKYTAENGVTYSKAEILAAIAAETSLTIYAKESTGSRVRLFKTAAVEHDDYLGDIADGTSVGDKDSTKGAIIAKNFSLATLDGSTITKLSTSSEVVQYYMYGGDTTASQSPDSTAVSGAVDIVVE